MISLTDAELLPAHPEDPVRENPYPTNHPGHRVWASTTHEADEDLFRFQQKMLERRCLSGEQYRDWHIELIFGKFQIWAKRGLSVVRSRADARAYEQWLESYSQSWLTLMEEKCPELGLRSESFLPKLKVQLLRASKYWSGNALESVRAFRKSLDAEVFRTQTLPAGAATNATPTPPHPGPVTNGNNTGSAATPVQVEAPLDPVARERQAMLAEYKSEVHKVTGKELRDAAIYGKLPHKDAKGQFISWKFNKGDSTSNLVLAA